MILEFTVFSVHMQIIPQGLIQDFSEGDGVGWCGWYLEVAESKESKIWLFDNWNLIKKCYTRNRVQVMLQSRNYDELPVQSVSLYFFHNHNFFKVLFPQIGGG